MISRFVVLAFACTLLAQQQLDRAWDLAASGRRPEAIAVLGEFIRVNPNNAEGRLLLGSLLMEQGRKEQSIEHLRAAVRLRPNSEEAHNALGEAYNKFGDTSEARAAFEKAVRLKPDYGIAQSNLGLVLLNAGDNAGAAKHLDRAIQLLGRTDDAADAHYLRAKIETSAGNLRQAEGYLKLAVTIRPQFAEAWSDLGQIRKTLLDDAGALTAFERAVTADPQDAVAQYRLGAEYLRQEQPHLAVGHLQQASRLNPADQSVLNSLQIALRREGDIEGANRVKQRLADALLEKDRLNQNQLAAVKLNNEGAILEKAGNLPEALKNYAEATRLDPEHNGIRTNYGIALLRLGRWKEGLDQLREALRREPANQNIQRALEDALRQAPR
ncbi:MAG: tetratricopeptide repeat protein [Acidobacteriota bacterium]|nr:tetratricopeptide repeat protein [Acidobacteriota bacterium]